MFSKPIKKILILFICAMFLSAGSSFAEDAEVATVGASSLPINVAGQNDATSKEAAITSSAGSLVSPSEAQSASESNKADVSPKEVAQQPSSESKSLPQAPKSDDFNFDLKMKSINAANEQPSKEASAVVAATPTESVQKNTSIDDADLPKEIQYKASGVENLGNSVLSQMDSDLFVQMSEIEKSTTLLTLELRREKIRNEIEAQKAIRLRNAENIEKEKREEQLRIEERKRQIEAQVIKEQQLLIDKEKIFETLRQRKLLNAYMNQMLVERQEWLKEKEALYERLAAADQEKKELIELFKRKIGKVLEASAKNIQTAEMAKANFERIVKGLKSRNEQLRKRIEADAQIIKNSKNNLSIKTPSIEELKDKNASLFSIQTSASPVETTDEVLSESFEDEETDVSKKLSAEYAILGIAGRSGVMSVDVIDAQGVPMSLKIGSPLPTGHVVSEIGADYVKFSKDGKDDYLYIGKTIDGVVPTLGLVKEKD